MAAADIVDGKLRVSGCADTKGSQLYPWGYAEALHEVFNPAEKIQDGASNAAPVLELHGNDDGPCPPSGGPAPCPMPPS